MKKSAVFLIIGIAVFVFSNGRWTVPVMAWLAPLFLLQSMRTGRPWIGLPVAAVLFVGAAGVMLHGIIPLQLGGLGRLLSAYYGLLWFIPYLIDRLLRNRPTAFLSTLVFPCASVAAEYGNAVALGNWGSTAITQLDNLPFAQLLSLTGLWGITFLVAWFGPVVLWIRENRWEWKKTRGGISVFSGAVVAVLFYGGLRLAITEQQGPTVRIASLHLDDDSMNALSSSFPDQEGLRDGYADVQVRKQRALDLYFEKSAHCARQGAAVVFWPEAAVAVGRDEEAGFLARASSLALDERVYFMPAYHLAPASDGTKKGENMCALFEPSGREVWRYVKAHPVPGSPDASGTQGMAVIEAPFGRLAVAICYDLDFPSLIRQAGQRKADIMLVPAWDWKAIDPLHSRMAVCRAIENGFSMVRHSVEGLSLAVDGLGRPLAAMDHFRTEERLMLVDVPAAGVRTVYPIAGDVVAWLSLIGLVILAILPAFRRPLSGLNRQ